MSSIERAMKSDDHAELPCSEWPRGGHPLGEQPRKRFTKPTLERLGKVPEVTGFSF